MFHKETSNPPNSRMESIKNKESVELIVYLVEVLTKPETNKQYPTPAVIYFENSI